MKKNRLFIRSIILLVLIGATAFAIYSSVTEDKTIVGKGDQAPDFVLTDLDGNEVKLSDYRGKGVFLNFWGTWCPPCKREMPFMNSQYKEYKDKGVVVIAVNAGESRFVVEKFNEDYGLEFPMVIDNDSQVLDAYNIDPLPTTFLIDKDGKIVDKITAEMTEDMIADYMEMIKP